MNRKKTREIKIGKQRIGNFNPILIQSMCNTKTEDVISTVKQIKELEAAGCQIIRVAVPNIEAAKAIEKIKNQINIPLVADIHFDYRLAIESINYGADKIRINPGNIGDSDKLKAVVEAAKLKNIPIRIGVNSGSLEKTILEKYKSPVPEALVESAMYNVELIEKLDYNNIVVSIKSSDVLTGINAYALASEKMDYPLHIGVTEAGTMFSGTIKSSVGLGIMLSMGIGDTLRVSITGDPVEEVRIAKKILQSLELCQTELEFVSCPTCGRTEINLINIANEVERRCEGINKKAKIAVMGCVVNGPGEAKEADLGIAGGKGVGIIFKKGVVVKKVSEEMLVEALMEEINKL